MEPARLDPAVAQAPAAPRPPHPAIWMLLIIPFGASAGFVGVGLTYMATRNGVLSITQGALLTAASLAAQWLKWMWAPAVDVSLTAKRWYHLANAFMAATILAMSLLPMTPSTLPLLLAVIALSSIASSVIAMSVESALAASTPPSQQGRVSGWMQAGNLGGTGIGGGLGLYLLEHLPSPWMSGVIMAALMLCCGFGWRAVHLRPCEHAAANVHAVGAVLRDLWTTLRTRTGLLAGILLLLPLGTGAASGVLTQAAVAARWGADANAVALTQGVLSGLVTAGGCFAGGWICERLHPRWTYVAIGVLIGAVDVGMALAPTTPTAYVVGNLAYSFGVGIAYAAYTAVVLDAIGVGSAATKFSLLSSLANFPIWWLGLLLGIVSDHQGAVAMLYTEAGLSVLGALVFTGAVLLLRAPPRMPAPA